jgi:lysophospholipase L1-like esterase
MKQIILSVIALMGVVFTATPQSVTPFKDGDRAVFLGNSITDGGHYHSYIWLYYMTRFPDMDLRVVNAGVGGDTALNMVNRFDTDVTNHRPTVLTVTFGMNDTGYFEYNGDDAAAFGERKYKETVDNYKLLEERLKGLLDTRVVQLGGSPYDETAKIENTAFRGKNAVMQRVVEFQKASADENGWEFVDFNAPMVVINAEQQATDPAFALCGSDRVHPGNDGHMVMAYLYLKAQGFVGREVADVEIDARKATTLKSVNAEITDVRKNGHDLTFDYLAGSLPYPLDTLNRSRGTNPQSYITRLVPSFTEDMNREMLTVKGLARGNYKLLIDGEYIGTWNNTRFADGINLAEQTWTPQYQQAMSVMYLNEYRWELERTFRELAWINYNFFRPHGMLFAYDRASVEEIDKYLDDGWIRMHKSRYAAYLSKDVREARLSEMEGLIEQIYTINKPQRRTITLHKVD